MTSEVVVMNRLAVALAADSASTVSGPNSRKIWNSANKLFALSKCHPVGVMVYNSASILGVPWETIIKMYRAKLAKDSFPHLEQYAGDFVNFLNSSRSLFPEELQSSFFRRSLSFHLLELKERADNAVFEEYVQKQNVTTVSEQFARIVADELDRLNEVEDLNLVTAHSPEVVAPALEDIITRTIAETTEGLEVSPDTVDQLRTIAAISFSKNEFNDTFSGIVFAGFGDNEHYPVLNSFQVGGMIMDHLKCSVPVTEKISEKNESVVTPFAQSEMVDTFLHGINLRLANDLVRNFVALATELPKTVIDSITDLTEAQREAWKNQVVPHAKTAIDNMMEKLSRYRYERHWSPVHNALIHLPKDELAHVAEALVNLSSFQKKVSMDDETVGGPIDVAVISKGDGLIWIKRKHYFDRELNEHYFENLSQSLAGA